MLARMHADQLLAAAGAGDAARLQALLADEKLTAQVRVDSLDLLLRAVRANSRETVKMLLASAPTLAADTSSKLPSTRRLAAAALLEAARFGADTVLAPLFLRGVSPDVQDEHSLETPLDCAVAGGHEAIVRLLLAQGANVEGAGLADGTPLYLAVRHRMGAIATRLLDRGADANVVPNDCPSPLTMAVRHGDAPLVSALLEGGADPLDADAILRAVDAGRDDLVRLLLEHGAHPASRTREGGPTALHMAALKGDTAIARLLIGDRPRRVLERQADGVGTALHAAAANGHVGMCRLLCDAGADREARGAHGRTPLLLALARRREEAAAYLAHSAGADVKAVTDKGWGALHVAADAGCGTALGWLTQDAALKAQLDAGDSSGRTPLLLACVHGHTAAALALLTAGARADNGCSAPPFSPLYAAVQPPLDRLRGAAFPADRLQLVEALLRAGAVPTWERERSPMQLAAAWDSSALMQVLLEHAPAASAPQLEKLLAAAVAGGGVGAARALFDAGATGAPVSPHATSTLLHVAAADGDGAMVALLLDRCKGITKDPAYRDDTGRNSFHLAVTANSLPAARALWAAAAPTTRTFQLLRADEQGYGPLLALMRDRGGWADPALVAFLLRTCGEDPNAPGERHEPGGPWVPLTTLLSRDDRPPADKQRSVILVLRRFGALLNPAVPTKPLDYALARRTFPALAALVETASMPWAEFKALAARAAGATVAQLSHSPPRAGRGAGAADAAGGGSARPAPLTRPQRDIVVTLLRGWSWGRRGPLVLLRRHLRNEADAAAAAAEAASSAASAEAGAGAEGQRA
jgi:ankyrin repeat protein